jgi:hypothetical protein
MRTGIKVQLSAADRTLLDTIVADRNGPQKHVWRAKILLLTADGCGTAEVMRNAGVSKTAVWRGQERFMPPMAEGEVKAVGDRVGPSVVSVSSGVGIGETCRGAVLVAVRRSAARVCHKSMILKPPALEMWADSGRNGRLKGRQSAAILRCRGWRTRATTVTIFLSLQRHHRIYAALIRPADTPARSSSTDVGCKREHAPVLRSECPDARSCAHVRQWQHRAPSRSRGPNSSPADGADRGAGARQAQDRVSSPRHDPISLRKPVHPG